MGLQYYTTHDITLRRSLESGARTVVWSRVVREEGRTIDEVVVRKGTPGVVVRILDSARLQVSFEEGTDITFAGYTSGQKYCLTGRNRAGGDVDVDFQRLTYRAVKKSGLACLEIDEESLSELEKQRRVLRGRRIP